MTPEALSVHPFESIDLQIEKRAVRHGYVWDFAYRLRLIHPDKSSYTIPALSVYWLVRDFGEALEEAEVQQVETAPAIVRYVTTIMDSGLLDIRDTLDLGDYAPLATAWTAIAWVVSPLPLLIWILYVARLSRRPRPIGARDRTDQELDHIEQQLSAPPSVALARRQLRRTICQLRDTAPGEDRRTLPAIERDLVIATRDYLHAELPELNHGDTAREIRNHVETRVSPGDRQAALLALASRLVVYQRRLELGVAESVSNPDEEARALDLSLDHLRPHVQMWRRVRNGLTRTK